MEIQVSVVVGPAVLPSDDVFDVEPQHRGGLRQPAILAPVPGPTPDEVAGGAVHSGRPGLAEAGVSLGFEYAEERVGADHRIEFFEFSRGQLSFRSLVGKFIVAGLGLGVGLNA